jgi:hypothetical protein
VQVARLHHGCGSHIGSGNWNWNGHVRCCRPGFITATPVYNAQHLYQPIGIEELGKGNFAFPYAAIQRWQDATDKSAQIAFTAETPNVVDAPATTMDQSVEDSIGSQRLAESVIGTFGGLGVCLRIQDLHSLTTSCRLQLVE